MPAVPMCKQLLSMCGLFTWAALATWQMLLLRATGHRGVSP
jgi:hypothetical protein